MPPLPGRISNAGTVVEVGTVVTVGFEGGTTSGTVVVVVDVIGTVVVGTDT